MSIDPGDPDTFPSDPADAALSGDLDPEADIADAVDQHAELRPSADDPLEAIDVDGVDVADAVDQARVAGFDDDEDGRE